MNSNDESLSEMGVAIEVTISARHNYSGGEEERMTARSRASCMDGCLDIQTRTGERSAYYRRRERQQEGAKSREPLENAGLLYVSQ